MWTEIVTNNKGTRYKFYERYTDPITRKERKVSVTMNSSTRHAQKEAAVLLREKIQEKTKTAAERKVELLAHLTLATVLDEWLEFIKPTVKVRTAEGYAGYLKLIKANMSPALLFVDFTSVTAERFIRDMYYVKMRSYGYSKTMLTIIHRVMKYAKRAGYIDSIEDFTDIELKKRPTTAKELQKAANKFLNHDELRDCLQQLNSINHRLALAMEFISLTGLRCGELLALRVQDYDKEHSTININGTLVGTAKNGEDIQRGTPKNIYSYRDVHLNSRAINILDWFITDNRRAMLWTQGQYKDKGYIFTTNRGNPYNLQFIARKLRRIRITDKHISTHIFRHTHISILAEMGVPLKAIMQRVGHNDPNTTLSIYTHVTNTMTEEANKKIDSMIV